MNTNPPTTGELTFKAGRRDGKKTTVTACREKTVLHRDQVVLDNSKDRSRYIDAVLEFVPRDDWPENAARVLDEALMKLADRASEPADQPPTPDPDPSAAKLAETDDDVKADAEALLKDPSLMRRVVSDVGKLGVAGEKHTVASIYLIGTSRKLRRPLAGIVQGLSSSGKTFVIEQVAGLFPPEDVVHATQMTPQALFHMPPGSLVHRWVVAGERSRIDDDERAEATRALREMLSTGRLSKLCPMKAEGGAIVTQLIEQEGPIAFVESTSKDGVFEEDANRCLLLQTDDREEQTRKVIEAAARGYAGKQADDLGRMRLVHQTAQRMLPRCGVVIPFAERVGNLFDSKRVDSRRNFGHLMGLVAASALLHAFRRARDENDNVVATSVDYQYAAALAAAPFGKAGGGVSPAAVRFFDRLKKQTEKVTEFTSQDARKSETAGRATVYGWLAALCDVGAIEQTEAGKGRKPAKWKLTGVNPNTAALAVPDAKEVFKGDASGSDTQTQPVNPWE